jgi:DNA-binding NarL/FixJ family response regulator
MVNQRRVSEPILLRHGDVVAIGIEALEFVDLDLLHRPESLSTIPPPSMPTRVGDADEADSVTLAPGTETLTDRERQVLELIALGHTQREVASRLCISAKTVETHRARIAEKLQCHSRADFVTRAITAGFLRGR